MKKILSKEENIAQQIFFLRGIKVMIDSDLALIYGVTTARLNEQVKRNRHRFPKDFMFRITTQEWKNLISQSATSRWGGRRKLPFAFTEHGAVMLASVLNSQIAVEASIHVVRAFVKLRELLSSHKVLAAKLQLLEHRSDKHDNEIQLLFEAIRQLIQPSVPERKRIGFKKD